MNYRRNPTSTHEQQENTNGRDPPPQNSNQLSLKYEDNNTLVASSEVEQQRQRGKLPTALATKYLS